MKKFMRIALVFALAGATLMYTGCTKDYSGDISDLNKKVSEQASALSALQTQVAAAQSSASEALSSAQNALKEAQAAAKAAEAANNDAEVAALTTKIATIEGNIADLQAKVEALNGLEAKLNEVADQLKKDVDAKVDAALEEIQKELEKAIAQVEGNFSVEALGGTAKYASAKWAPSNKAGDKRLLAKLVEKFPELAELKKGDKVETFGHLDFIVNPSSVALDDTYTFALIGKDGKDSKVVLGNPTKGYATKAGLNVWNVEVQSPAYNSQGAVETPKNELALVVENAAGVYAQTLFTYTVEANDKTAALQLDSLKGKSFTFDDTKSENSFNAFEKLFQKKAGAIYDNYFIIEADAADVEEFGIKFDGSKITLTEAPTKDNTVIPFTITAVGVDGSVSQAKNVDFKVTYTKSIAPNAELAAQDVTLGYNAAAGSGKEYNVAVKYNVADFGFSALEWKTVYEALALTGADAPTIKITDSKKNNYSDFVATGGLSFLKADGQTARGYSDAVAFGFNVNSAKAIPGTYNVAITSAKGIFAGKGELTIANPETCPVKLIEALCKDGVLQVVGEVKNKGDEEDPNYYIEYSLENALVYNSNEAKIVAESFVDLDQTSSDEDNWVKDSVNFSIPTAKPWANLLYKTRNFSVDFAWFTNEKTTEKKGNIGTFEFKAQAVSPIYDAEGKAVTVANQTIYIKGDKDKGEPSSFEVNKIVTSAKYVAGDNVGKAYNVFKTWKLTGSSNPAKYKYYTESEGAYEAPNTSEGSDTQTANTKYSDAFGLTVTNTQYVLDEDGYPIEFTDFDLETIKLFNSNVTTGQFTALKSYIAGEDAEPLYFTTAMFDSLARVWAKYYDENGEKIGAKTKSGDLMLYHSVVESMDWTKYTEAQRNGFTLDYFKSEIANMTTEEFFNDKKWKEGITASNLASKVGNVIKKDGAAVALFDKYGNLAKEETTPAGKIQYSYKLDDTKPVATELGTVKVAFDDPTYAKQFVSPYENITPNSANEPVSVEANGDARLAGLNSVTLKAYIEIADNWGMTMKIPFTVTVKTATK